MADGLQQVLERTVDPHQGKPWALIPALQGLQQELGYLPAEAMEAVAAKLGVPLSRVYGVATFYSQFSLKPRGRHLIRVCVGTACHVRGAPEVFDELARFLEVDEDGLSRDRQVAVETVRCLGACALAPVVVAVDGKYYGGMSPAKARALLKRLVGGEGG
ncbi:MAG: NAD(P)H-dependent oxidoreductase subunit E [Candidatus Bipolaricaulaceae bacterium]